MIESVKIRGVLKPLTVCYSLISEKLVLVDGQQRLIGAMEAELKTVPVQFVRFYLNVDDAVRLDKRVTLSEEEQREAATTPMPIRKMLVVGMTLRYGDQVIDTLWGDGLLMGVPFETFEPSGDDIVPDFDDPEIIDHGQTLRFGKYEAATNSLRKS